VQTQQLHESITESAQQNKEKVKKKTNTELQDKYIHTTILYGTVDA
jgi:hypothetical protein